MTTELRDRAPAKINLTLRILGRRADGYHALESLVVFADLADELWLEPASAPSLEVAGPFAAASGAPADNLVLKAARLAGLPSGRFTLDKRIPVAAGLGGGSSDAAAALRLIAQRNGLAADDPRFAGAAKAAGADVPVCLDPRARIMRGIGEELSVPILLPRLPALLVNPRVAVSTKEIFAEFAEADRSADPIGEIPLEPERFIGWLAARGNDLTRAAIKRAPVIAEVLAALEALAGCRLARMSGSGATCFALFDTPAQAADAATGLSQAHGNWWICPVTLG